MQSSCLGMRTYSSNYFHNNLALPPPGGLFGKKLNPIPHLHFKPLSLTCCKKEDEDLTFSRFKRDVLKNEDLHVEVLKQVISLFGLVFNSLATSSAVGNLFKDGDLVQVPRNGVSTLAYVEKVCFSKTNFQSDRGNFTILNSKIDSSTILNFTIRVDSSKYFGIHDEFEIGNKNTRELTAKIEEAITKMDHVKDMTDHNVIIELPNKKLLVCCYVHTSKLGGLHEFNSYMKVRREVIHNIKDVITNSPLFGFLSFLSDKSPMEPSSRGAPPGVLASPSPKQRIAHSNLIRWDFLDVNDLITTDVGGKQIFGFVESKGWLGITIKMRNGRRIFLSKEKASGVIIKFDDQRKNEERVNWRFTTELKIEMHQVDSVEKEIYKIFKEDKDLVQEDALVLLSGVDWSNRTAVFLVSWITKSGTHEEYFRIREALLLKLQKLIDTNS